MVKIRKNVCIDPAIWREFESIIPSYNRSEVITQLIASYIDLLKVTKGNTKSCENCVIKNSLKSV